MPIVVLPNSGELPRKLWTRDDVRRLLDAGLLDSDKHYELLEGEIVENIGQNEPHIFVCMQALRILMALFGADRVHLPAPIAINGINEPEPDAAVVKGTLRQYLTAGTPQPQDMELVVEVSDTTLNKDRQVKGPIYARAGIIEYWIVNINARKLEVYRNPTPDGYALTMILNDTETVRPLAKSDAEIAVKDLLP